MPRGGFHVVGADVLRDAAGFARRHLGAADVVQQRGLAVVDVAHDGDDRRARHAIRSRRARRLVGHRLPDRPARPRPPCGPFPRPRSSPFPGPATWLMVTIWPSFISCLITSDALTAILCASSATVMVSGTCTSMMTRFGRRLAVASRGGRDALPRRPRGPPRQLSRPHAAARHRRGSGCAFFLADRPPSWTDSLADLTSLSAPRAGWCVAPVARRGRAGARRQACAACPWRRLALTGSPWPPAFPAPWRHQHLLGRGHHRADGGGSRPRPCGGGRPGRRRAAASSAARAFGSRPRPSRGPRPALAAPARRLRRLASGGGFGGLLASASAFFCSSRRRRLAARSSASRSRAPLPRAGGASRPVLLPGGGSVRPGGALLPRGGPVRRRRRPGAAARGSASGASTTAVSEPSSRWTKVRFLRTSTWIVRALPVASACLISVVDFFTSA